MRLFVAAPVPASDVFVAATQDLGPCRPVPSGSWHITLRFLGEAPDVDVVDALQAVRHAPLDVAVRGVGAFPHPHRARVAWAAVDAPGLDNLAAQVESATGHLGKPPERRDFVPHVTLARMPHPRDVRDWVRHHQHTPFATGRIDHIRLMASHLGPDGAHHQEVARFLLAEA